MRVVGSRVPNNRLERCEGRDHRRLRERAVSPARLASAGRGALRFAAILLSAACTLATGPGVRAQQVEANGHWLPRIRLDNDAYNFWQQPGQRSDEEYTNGVVVSLEALHGAWWGRHLAGARPGCNVANKSARSCLTTSLMLGQDLYTPNLDRAPFTSDTWDLERPYAAWLYMGTTGRVVSRRTASEYTATIGVTGQPALGKLSQRIAHQITAGYTTLATGWETQVGTQVGAQLATRQRWLVARAAPSGKGVFDLSSSAGASVGTIRTAVDIGATMRLGYNVSHPWDPREWLGRSPLEFFVSSGGRVEGVAYDFSLDGTLRNPARRVERVNRVNEYEFGTGLRMHRLTVGWRAITRSREYQSGPGRHTFSSMYSVWEFPF